LIFGDFAPPTGWQENAHVAKMGKLKNGVTERGFELDSHPGDAVRIAPVSSQIPCKQGILQGKSRFLTSKRQSRSKKSLCSGDFLGIP
jgi:hypothetical protein